MGRELVGFFFLLLTKFELSSRIVDEVIAQKMWRCMSYASWFGFSSPTKTSLITWKISGKYPRSFLLIWILFCIAGFLQGISFKVFIFEKRINPWTTVNVLSCSWKLKQIPLAEASKVNIVLFYYPRYWEWQYGAMIYFLELKGFGRFLRFVAFLYYVMLTETSSQKWLIIRHTINFHSDCFLHDNCSAAKQREACFHYNLRFIFEDINSW